ncbi:MAG: NADH-ubiquinone oxidoreductase-F iron-sulfur binding region domain-containing protein, partial [Oscillospiraceae bacterium]|nr:NADH-ubiquinone oxidoreductase-F iron-sulfur binding region domain-containing protein [Oscillospiraceae bacterium]
EPVVEVMAPGKPKITYVLMNAKKATEIAKKHLLGGKPLGKYTLTCMETAKELDDDAPITALEDLPFYNRQFRIALRNCGIINPENIDEYIARGGYQALGKALTGMTPDAVIAEITASGLRGRGGAGFLTGEKWRAAADRRGMIQKYICCNADEGDPGAFKDRSILESDPHAILEAMVIAGYAIGADQGYLYVRAEYPLAVKHLRVAIAQARQYGLLGDHVMGSSFRFHIDLRLGAGAFVCGEETALISSMEGKRGEPMPRPPFPTAKGLFGKPTVLNNVETLSNVPQIIANGAVWFNSMGTETSKGTKVFTLGGKIHHAGLVEIPLGTTLDEIVEDIGGGIPNGKIFKAVQAGGPSGGCIPADKTHVPIDYDNLDTIGAMMGSGGLIIMDSDSCMVDIAKFFLGFTVDESCGKCAPCRIGTKRMLEILEKITAGDGTLQDLKELEELGAYIKDNAQCGLGQTAPNPVLSTIRCFREEYLAHIVNKKCPARVCEDLLVYTIDPAKCRGCTLCARTCPAGAITGLVKRPHTIDSNRCVKCGSCQLLCHFGAVSKQ